MALELNEVSVSREIGGRTLKISTGLLARQAAGAAVIQYGDTVVLSAVTTGKPRFQGDFFPLMVDYREKMYAAGKFPGGFFKREKAPSTNEILTMRLTDRPIRPLFPKAFREDVIIQSMVISADFKNDPDILSIIGASTAICLSTLPFAGPVGAVRMGFKDGAPVVNPFIPDYKDNRLNLTLAGTSKAVTMVEAGADELTEEEMLAAIEAGHAIVREIVEMQNELVEKAGRAAQDEFVAPEAPSSLAAVTDQFSDKIRTALREPTKFTRRDACRDVRDEILAAIATPEGEDGPDTGDVKEAYEKVRGKQIRDMAKEGSRVDGRDLTTVRDIDCRVGLLPGAHGSSLFTRGETQALVAITLGTVSDTQRVDGLLEDAEFEQWYLHYQAPGFSVGECRMPRGPSRRDIGHGMLGQRALQAVMPHDIGFPYTVRAVSEILEMNGSSSMATVCGATLALMDAGVPIKKPVAGIAMGLIHDEGSEPVILTDILGDEDHCGDMDFKVCGTADGITALQMDVKVEGISADTMQKALTQAKVGRQHILDCITTCMTTPREELNPNAPRIETVKVPIDILGKIIGPGGKTIRALQDSTGARIDIADDGVITICAPDGTKLAAAIDQINLITAVPEIGKDYMGKVTSVRDFGAFFELFPGTEGMCHISEISDKFVDDIDNAVKVGQEMMVKVVNIDDFGKIRLSRKAVLVIEAGGEYDLAAAQRPPARSGGGGRDRRPARR